jgi:hypothetical protein
MLYLYNHAANIEPATMFRLTTLLQPEGSRQQMTLFHDRIECITGVLIDAKATKQFL